MLHDYAPGGEGAAATDEDVAAAEANLANLRQAQATLVRISTPVPDKLVQKIAAAEQQVKAAKNPLKIKIGVTFKGTMPKPLFG